MRTEKTHQKIICGKMDELLEVVYFHLFLRFFLDSLKNESRIGVIDVEKRVLHCLFRTKNMSAECCNKEVCRTERRLDVSRGGTIVRLFEMSKYIVFFCRISIVVFCCFAEVAVTAEITKEEQRKASAVFTGVDDTMLRINAGVCRIRGKTVFSGDTVHPDDSTINDDDILMAFNYQSRFYRFDNGNQSRSLFTPDAYYQVWNVNTAFASIVKSSVDKPNISPDLNYIEILSLPLFVPAIGPPNKPYTYLETMLHKKDFKYIEYQEFPNGLVRIKVELPRFEKMPADMQTYTVDTKNGYTLRQLEHSFGWVSDISWENINNTWVPVSYVLKAKKDSRAEEPGVKRSVDWKIEWEQINEKVDPKYFDLTEMVADLQKESGRDIPIYSEELGQMLQIGNVGKDTGVKEELKHEYNYLNLTLVAIGGLLILVSLCKMYYDRRKTRVKQ